MKWRIMFFLSAWLAFWFLFVNYYTVIFPFNDPIKVGEISATSTPPFNLKNENLLELFSFFDNKIGIQNLSYNVVVYNNFKLFIEATDPPLTYIDSVMQFDIASYQEVTKVNYNTSEVLWRGLKKDELSTAIRSIKSIGFTSQNPGDLSTVLIGADKTLTIGTYGNGWIKQELDYSSRLILFIAVPFILIWVLTSFQTLIYFLRHGMGGKI